MLGQTVRKLAHAMAVARSGEGSNSPMATGSDGVPVQIPPDEGRDTVHAPPSTAILA
jgi:hypothetical protein